jgi:exosortase C (VPDSG-CTERM-specific)
MLPAVAPTSVTVSPPPPAAPRSLRPFWTALAALVLVFAWPLSALALYSLEGGLHSHIVLIPAVSLYFVWLQRPALKPATASDRAVAIGFFAAALAVLSIVAVVFDFGRGLPPNDQLAGYTTAFLLLLVAVCAWGLGRPLLKQLAFPLTFLVFMIPLPTVVIEAAETFLQHGSALAAYGMIKLIGTPVFRDGLVFMLPGFSMEVAPQCSGINSSYALLITSVAASFLFLRTPWRRALLIFAVIPLGLLRNGLRVTVIGELCVRISPDMINSWVHKHGGPFFFALSLIPFSILLLWLYRADRKASTRPNVTGGNGEN